MRIAVCVRYAPSGELGPFDAAAYEEAYAGGTTSAEEQQPPAAEIPAP